MTKNYKHITVLLNEAINALNINCNGIYIDGTFGLGGHSRLILSKLGENGRLLAFDRDPEAIIIANKITDPRFSIFNVSFSSVKKYIENYSLMGNINGIILDLGVSSSQLDNPKRGFSFMRDGPLDMRMDQKSGKSAAEWLQTTNEDTIAWVLRTFGEERFSKRIADAIFKRNRTTKITSTRELAEIISTAIPVKEKYKHPATRSFQAIRIWINNELKEIEIILQDSLDILSPGGRLVVISFHSLEDRIVKRFMRNNSRMLSIPGSLPITEKQLKKISNHKLKLIGRFMPSKKEIAKNPRARSSILRVAEKK